MFPNWNLFTHAQEFVVFTGSLRYIFIAVSCIIQKVTSDGGMRIAQKNKESLSATFGNNVNTKTKRIDRFYTSLSDILIIVTDEWNEFVVPDIFQPKRTLLTWTVGSRKASTLSDHSLNILALSDLLPI